MYKRPRTLCCSYCFCFFFFSQPLCSQICFSQFLTLPHFPQLKDFLFVMLLEILFPFSLLAYLECVLERVRKLRVREESECLCDKSTLSRIDEAGASYSQLLCVNGIGLVLVQFMNPFLTPFGVTLCACWRCGQFIRLN